MRRVSTAIILTILSVTIIADPGESIERRQKSDAPPGAAGATGMIVSVSGGVSVSGRRGEMEAYEGLGLAAGDSVTVGPGAAVSGFRPSGEPFEAKGPATLGMTVADGEFPNRIHDWTSRQIGSWDGLGVANPFGTPARYDWGAATVEATPMVPADGGSVRPDSSRFLWKTIAGLERYELEIVWQDGNRARRTRTTVKGGNLLTLEGLEPGREYQWRVRTDEGKKIQSSANTFRVLTVEETTMLDESTYGLPDLMAGALLLTAGLHEEAIEHFDAALDGESTRRSALVWRSRALAATGRYEAAYRDLIDAMVNDAIEQDAFSDSFQFDGLTPKR